MPIGLRYTQEQLDHGEVWVTNPQSEHKCRVLQRRVPVTPCFLAGTPLTSPAGEPCLDPDCNITDQDLKELGPYLAAHLRCRKSGLVVFGRGRWYKPYRPIIYRTRPRRTTFTPNN
jgi:hypothetical protein